MSNQKLAAIHPVHGETHYGDTVEAAIRSAFGAEAFFHPSQDPSDPYDGRFVSPSGNGVDVLGYGWVEGPHEPKAIPDPEPITSAAELLKLIQKGAFVPLPSECFIEMGRERPGPHHLIGILDHFLSKADARYKRVYGEPEEITIRVRGERWSAKVLVARIDLMDPDLVPFLEAWVARR